MVDTCELVKSVVENCGEIWNRCYSSKEVRRMRDLHIEALVRQYGELGELDDCELVKKYRQSGRTLADPVEDVACSDEKTREIQTMFQTCSHSTATSVYQTIQDITSVKIISHKLCKALTTIGTVCIKHLYQCFAEEDVKQMRKSHLEEMKIFFLRISEYKVPNNLFENCVVMEYVENEEQEDIVLTDLDNNSGDITTESEKEDEADITQDNEDDIFVQTLDMEDTGLNDEIDENENENIGKSDLILTTTEESITELVKGEKSVDVKTNLAFSSNDGLQKEFSEQKSYKEKTTEVHGKIVKAVDGD